MNKIDEIQNITVYILSKKISISKKFSFFLPIEHIN